MDYDEDLLVELIACGDVSQTEIAERVGVSRRTVWRIANGHSRPDLQQKIADTVEGYRQETIRMAARFMKPLLKKQIEVALEGDGETARKSREFLLKTFMLTLPEQAAKASAKREPNRANDEQLDGAALYNSLVELPPDLKRQVVEELVGPTEDSGGIYEGKEDAIADPPQPAPDDPVIDPLACKKMPDPFANYVDGPFGEKIHIETIRLIEEAKAEAATIPTRRRVPRAPRE